MKKRSIGVVIALLISLLFIYLALPAKYKSLSRSYQERQPSDKATNPASDYAIRADEIEHLKLQARNGDCQAAQRLGAYYMNYKLDYNNAVIWFRMAARRPDIASKEYLIVLLRQVENHPEIDAELDRLILEIRALDPARAAELETYVKEMRH
ncbi:MAG: hypothetical protein JWQ01_3814 [Massilia sp.]|jgi:hypothetical protein|nr:hypothetical protein [Massilia sp.]